MEAVLEIPILTQDKTTKKKNVLTDFFLILNKITYNLIMCHTISLIITIYQSTTWNELIFAQRVVPVIHLPISIETLHYNQRNKLKKYASVTMVVQYLICQ